MNAMEIGKKLKEARIVSGHTQEEIAEEIQVSRQTISNCTNGAQSGRMRNVIQILFQSLH